MNLADIQNSIYRRTHTNSDSFTNADMLLAINRAYEKVNAIIRKHIDNYRPTLFTSSDLTTGTVSPVCDSLYHDLIALWPSYEYATENNLDNRNGFLALIQSMEKSLYDFYTDRSYFVFTVTIASPGVFTQTSHGLNVGDEVSFITSGALPTGLSADTYYFVISQGLTNDAFEVSATKDGTAINTSGSQSGTHWFFSKRFRRRMTTSSESGTRTESGRFGINGGDSSE